MTWGAVGAAAVGVVGSSLMSDSGGSGQQQTASKEPWAPAAPWLKNQITQGQQLQDFYGANPFNAQQQAGYQSLFDDLGNFRQQTAPGLMQFANNAMSGSYQRPRYEQPGLVGYRGGQQQQQAQQAPANNQPSGGLLAQLQAPGPFSVAQPANSAPSQYGLLDFQAGPPVTSNAQLAQQAPAAPVQQQNGGQVWSNDAQRWMTADDAARTEQASRFA